MFLVNLIDCDERQRREGDFSRAEDPTGASETREGLHCADALHDRLCNSSCRIGTASGNVVADSFEIVCGVRCPTDAHQPR